MDTVVISEDHFQGGHALWKIGKTEMVKKKFPAGKNQGIRNFAENQGNIREFKKSYLCKVKIFKFYSCSDVATGGFFLAYA